jgi:xanthine dehydrogenase accessory factor
VASHGHDEERVLTEALRSGVPYVALVASEVRGQAVRESLDLSDEQRARLQTPAGLEIGAETPEEIALAILAEIVSLRPEGEPGQVPRLSTIGMEAPRSEAPEPTSREPAPVALSTETAIDPVCGMEVAVSQASIHLERDGDLYYFCSEGCRDTFSSQGVPDGAAN